MDNKTKKERYFKKLQADPVRLAAYREKEKQRLKDVRSKHREKLKGRPDLQEKVRKEETLRKRKQREKKKMEVSQSIVTPIPCPELGSYKRPQSLGKAVNRIKRILPDSPSKKQAVVRKLLGDLKLLDLAKQSPQRKKRLSDEDKAKVVEFFCRDDISYQAPGKRDTKSVKDPVTKKRANLQKRYLVMSVKEAYQQFLDETSMSHIKKSTFYDLRPKQVLLVADTPHTVCVCKYHANFNFLLESLKNNGATEIDFCPNGKDMIRHAVCNIKNEECMLSSCTKCKGTDIEQFLVLKDYEPGKNIKWKQWVDVQKRPELIEFNGTIAEVITEIKKQLEAFKTHCFVKNIQGDEFETRKKKGLGSHGVLQIDFAENFSIISQDEIQSAHWSHEQVTLFTACAWVGDETISYCIVSNDLSHGKLAIKVFVNKIITDLLIQFPALQELSIFSDGPSSQFKNKYTAHLLCSLQKDYNIDIEWLFFATSHGKGAVDVIGGALKRRVWLVIKSRKQQVSSAYDFYKCAKSEIQGTHLFYISKEEVLAYEDEMSREWESVEAIPNIQRSHFMKPYYDCESILVARTVNSEMMRHNIIKEVASPVLSSKHHANNNDVYPQCHDLLEAVSSDIVSSKERVKYCDVYTDSESSESTIEDNLDANVMNDGMYEDVTVSETCNFHNVDQLSLNLNHGCFIEVELTSEKGLKHKYFAIYKGKAEENDLHKVAFLTQSTKKDKLFTLDENSASFESNVSVDQVVRVVNQPDVVKKGERLYYKFV